MRRVGPFPGVDERTSSNKVAPLHHSALGGKERNSQKNNMNIVPILEGNQGDIIVNKKFDTFQVEQI